jgi:hypothetical protein
MANTTYNIVLTEEQKKAMDYVCVDIQEFIQNAADTRARIATKEIVKIYTEQALDMGLQIPSSRLDIITDAYNRNIIKTAAQVNAERTGDEDYEL